MTGAEYRAILDRMPRYANPSFSDTAPNTPDPLEQILAVGKRNLDWLELINGARPADQKLELSTAATQVGIPIDNPRESNRSIIQKSLADLKTEMPDSMKEILFSSNPLPDHAPLADDPYLDFARKMDRVYQMASRWLLQEPSLWQYANFSINDIRGYYFLSREPNRDADLQGWNQLDSARQDRYSGWLVGQCRNSGMSVAGCRQALGAALKGSGGALAFFRKYEAPAKRRFDSFFRLQFPRSEVIWSSARPDVLVMPFVDPRDPGVTGFLRDNIEDEWKLGSWNLRLDFRPSSGRDLAHVVFVPGATPHVNGLGGSEITMDANRSIAEYTTRWTIRHEFGHVLGLPDCYVEFYDSDRGVMINYQIDVDNLMCSRRGKFQQIHFDELKANYYR